MDPADLIAGRERGGSLKERRFQFEQDKQETASGLQLLEQTRANALAEKTIAIKATELRNAAQQDLDAADFLKHFQTVRSTDPEFEDKVATLSATYPAALRDKAVQETLGITHARRQDFLAAAKEGGALAFDEGPARDTFSQTLTKTGNIHEARAAAKTVAEGEKSVRDAVAQGYLTAEDFAHTLGTPLPVVFNPDGSVNYSKARDVAALRAGKTTGKVQAAEDADLKVAQAYVTSFLKNPNALMADDDSKELYAHYSKQLLAHARKNAAAPAPKQGSVITTQAEYEALPPGASFSFNGRAGRKPQPK